MICPNCGYEHVRPHEFVYRDDGVPMRKYRCSKCGCTWETIEIRRTTAERQAFQATMWKLTNKKESTP